MKKSGCPPGQVLFYGACIPIPKNNKECKVFLKDYFEKNNISIVDPRELSRLNDVMYKEPKNFTTLKQKLLAIGGKQVIGEREWPHPLGGLNDRSHFFIGLAKHGKLYPTEGLRLSKLTFKFTHDEQGVKYKYPPVVETPLNYRMDVEKDKYGQKCYGASGYALDRNNIWKPHHWLICDGRIVELTGNKKKKYYGHRLKSYYDMKNNIERMFENW